MLRYHRAGLRGVQRHAALHGSHFDVLELAGPEAVEMVGAQIVIGSGASLQRPLSRGA